MRLFKIQLDLTVVLVPLLDINNIQIFQKMWKTIKKSDYKNHKKETYKRRRHKCIKGEQYCYIHLVEIIEASEPHSVNYLLIFQL